MKFIVLISLLSIFLIINISAQEFQINKIDELAYAQSIVNSESIQIIDNHLFFLNENGLEIYELNNDGILTKISVLTIAVPVSIVMHEQNCYISTRGYEIEGYHAKVYRIDISDVLNPEIIDQIEYNSYVGSIRLKKMGDNLIVQSSNEWNIIYKTYHLPEMTFLGQAIEDFYHNTINDSLLVCQENNLLYIKKHIPHGNFPFIGSIDVSAYSDEGGYYEHFKVINDTLLAAVNSNNITFWDIRDASDWQYISRYTLPINVYMFWSMQYAVVDENIILFTTDFIRLLDISEILNPILVDTLNFTYYFGGQACDNFENNLYVGTVSEGTMHYKIVNNTIEEITSYYDNIRFYKGFCYEDKIFAGSILWGYQLIDIQNPLDPINVGHWFDDKIYRTVNKVGGWIVLKDYEEYTLEIYDITDPVNPELKNVLPLDDYGFELTYCFIDETDPFSFFLCNHQTNKFWKFDISNPGEPVMLFEYVLPSSPRDHEVYNSTAYFSSGSSPFNLLILNGLEENNPDIANEINNFASNEYLDMQEGYLISFGLDQYEAGKVFQLEDPLDPQLYFVPQFGHKIYIRDNLLFSQYWHIISVYELSSSTSEPLAIFNGLNYNYNIELIEYEGVNYLLTIEMGNIGLFEYTYEPSSTEDELQKPILALTNYPNPFNPETTISFSLTMELTEDTEIGIYNIKGQKVDQLEITNCELGNNEVIWNAEGFASGIYMYQLKVDGKAIASKKCLFLK